MDINESEVYIVILKCGSMCTAALAKWGTLAHLPSLVICNKESSLNLLANECYQYLFIIILSILLIHSSFFLFLLYFVLSKF